MKNKTADKVFEKGNKKDGKHYWLTPPELQKRIQELTGIKFSKFFDPCPYPKPYNFDGLTENWGEEYYVNKELCNTKFVQSVNYKKRLMSLAKGMIENLAMYRNVLAVKKNIQKKFSNHRLKQERKPERIQKNIYCYQVENKDVLNVALLKHLILLISVLNQETNQNLVHTAKSASMNMHALRWQKEDQTIQRILKSKFAEIDIENLIKGKKINEKEVLLGITDVERIFSHGQCRIGNIANFTLETNVLTVDQKDFLLRIILSLYQVIFAQAQYQGIWFPPVKNVTLVSKLKTRLYGLIKKQSKGYIDIFRLYLKINSNEAVYVNPPFGVIDSNGKKIGATAWFRKAKEESLKGKLVLFVFPIHNWLVEAMIFCGANVVHLGNVKWLAIEDNQPGKGCGAIAMFILDGRQK